MLITFSGLDGAGKSTLIRMLREGLEPDRRVTVLTMYDDLTLFSRLRRLRSSVEQLVRRITGQKDSASRQVVVDDDGNAVEATTRVNATVYRLTRIVALRQCVYVVDLFIAAATLAYHRIIRGRVVLVDRYFYDSMVDIAAARAGHWFYTAEEGRQLSTARRFYVRAFLRLIPRPDVAILIGVPPAVAFHRKPEYPLHYVEGRWSVYQWLFKEIIPGGRIVENDDVAEAAASLLRIAHRHLGPPAHAA